MDMFVELWNEAYNLYCECGSIVMWRFLTQQVKDGKIKIGDAQGMYTDIIETYNL